MILGYLLGTMYNFKHKCSHLMQCTRVRHRLIYICSSLVGYIKTHTHTHTKHHISAYRFQWSSEKISVVI